MKESFKTIAIDISETLIPIIKSLMESLKGASLNGIGRGLEADGILTGAEKNDGVRRLCRKSLKMRSTWEMR